MYIDGDKKVEIIKCKDVILFYSLHLSKEGVGYPCSRRL